MKLLTCVVPCYNAAEYMHGAIDSLLAGGEAMDIIIIDDGSTDETGHIADEYARLHPDLVRVVHQPNGGHGAGINAGLREARGIYFKVVDSDDRLDTECLPGMLALLARHSDPAQQADLVVHDYVYDKGSERAIYGMSYHRQFKPDQLLTWQEVHHFGLTNQFMIHSLIYRTELLREHHLHLPEHTFYEDNLYIYQPLPWTKRLLYYPAPLYGYQVGRGDQSIAEKNIISRLDQVTSIAIQMICSYKLSELDQLPRTLRNYMINNCCGQLSTTCSLQFMEGTERGQQLNQQLWQAIRDFDPALYRALRWNPLGRVTCLPGKAGQQLLVWGYHTVRHIAHIE